jgi:hypothetical protein
MLQISIFLSSGKVSKSYSIIFICVHHSMYNTKPRILRMLKTSLLGPTNEYVRWRTTHLSFLIHRVPSPVSRYNELLTILASPSGEQASPANHGGACRVAKDNRRVCASVSTSNARTMRLAQYNCDISHCYRTVNSLRSIRSILLLSWAAGRECLA